MFLVKTITENFLLDQIHFTLDQTWKSGDSRQEFIKILYRQIYSFRRFPQNGPMRIKTFNTYLLSEYES